MVDSSKRPDGLRLLQETVVALSASRFEKYYHHSTGTHIIKQLEGTEFQPFPIKGFGEFADEAYTDYLSNLRDYVLNIPESELTALEKSLRRTASSAEKKVELQVQLPDSLTEQVNAQAKAANISVGHYLSRFILNNLPDKVDRSVVAGWLNKSIGIASTSKHTVTMSVPSGELDRMERFLVSSSFEQPATISDLIIGVLLERQHAKVNGRGQLH